MEEGNLSQFFNSVLIGQEAGSLLTTGSYNVFIGKNAGADITDESNVVIIGDDIRSLDKNQTDVIFLSDKVAIGKNVLDKPNSLWYTIKGIINE